MDLPKAKRLEDVADEVMTAYREQYENSIARHVCGVQPMSGPTGLTFAQG